MASLLHWCDREGLDYYELQKEAHRVYLGQLDEAEDNTYETAWSKFLSVAREGMPRHEQRPCAPAIVPGAPYLEAAASYLPIGSGVPSGTPFSQRVAAYRGLNRPSGAPSTR
jgi:hypothetical protein